MRIPEAKRSIEALNWSLAMPKFLWATNDARFVLTIIAIN
jgi:hypothetical protein